MSILLQAERLIAGTVESNAPVIFDSTVISAGNISYDSATGVITIQEPGRYEFDWWVAVQSSASAAGTGFALASSQGDNIIGNLPIKTGEVIGVGIVEVTAAPITVALRSSSSATTYYSATVPVKASLAVIGIADTGTTGPTGPTGPTGAVGTMADSTQCFAIRQLANLLEQITVLYPATTMTLFVDQLATLSGVAVEVYTAPGADGPGLLIIQSGSDYGYVSLSRIAAIYLGAGSVYDPSITYLPPPDPYAPGCDTDYILAVQSSMSVGDQISFGAATNTTGSGGVYINEPGILVLSDGAGNTPVFLFTPQIRYLVKDSLPSARTSGTGKPIKEVTIQNRSNQLDA